MDTRAPRAALAALVLLGASLGLAGCTPAGPMGVGWQGDTLVVVLGDQCSPAGYLTALRVRNIDERTNQSIDPTLWEIRAEQRHAVPTVTLGTVPEGYTETANNIAAQGVHRRVAVRATVSGNTYATTFDVRSIPRGKILNADQKVVTEAQFRRDNPCRS